MPLQNLSDNLKPASAGFFFYDFKLGHYPTDTKLARQSVSVSVTPRSLSQCGEMADAQDLKSWDRKKSCGFESHHWYHYALFMPALQSPDIHHLSAAEGWLELGNAREAQVELDCISAAAQGRVEVLAVRWGVLAQFKSWEQCVVVAERILELAPREIFGWIHRSYALHELKRTQTARDCLLPAIPLFPKIETIPYNLACYECQLGNLAAARDWFRRALKLHDRADLKARALADPDLKPLWSEIKKLPASAPDECGGGALA